MKAATQIYPNVKPGESIIYTYRGQPVTTAELVEALSECIDELWRRGLLDPRWSRVR